ncbi:MAG: hypothetical protein KDB68_11860 [Planctomycetes bacterium]|nr:hypothetical protein [Planctomycetota bacterium]MCA8946999.1 hypothetical protein [Planctomycetota bacterium]
MDDLANFLNSAEPYTSYRYVLGLVLTGLTVYYFYTGYASIRNMQGLLRDMNKQVNDQRLFDDVRLMLDPDYDVTHEKPLKAKPGRIIKLSVLSACLRLLSFRTLVYVFPELMGVIILGSAAIAAYWYVFTAKLSVG